MRNTALKSVLLVLMFMSAAAVFCAGQDEQVTDAAPADELKIEIIHCHT